jgi:eukaryotic-like serine/threonine-protein kinase
MTVKGKLWRATPDSDAKVLVSDSPSWVFSGAWLSPERLLVSGFRASYMVSPSGGSLQRLNEEYWWPQTLPDGEHVIYIQPAERTGRYQARVIRFGDPSSRKDLVETESRVLYAASIAKPGAGYLMYIRAGNLLAHPFDPRSLRFTGEAIPVASRIYYFATGAADFSVSDRGSIAYQSYVSRSQLVWVDRAGQQLATIGPPNINVKSARLSPDGKRLATSIYDIEQGKQDLWIFDVQTNAGRRLAPDAALRDAPVWSPDAKSLAFLGGAAGKMTAMVSVRGLGENDAEKLMPAGEFQMPTDWSPDGRFIAYVNTGFPRLANETQGDVWVFDLAHDGKTVPVLNTKFHEANPAFSPDGKWLAFTSNESGRPEVYIQEFRADGPGVAGERYLVSRAGALALRWRRDGGELFYIGFDGRVQAVPVKLSPKPAFGEAKALFTISTEARAAIHSFLGFDVSADGQRFVIPVVSAAEGPSIVVVQNWEELLSRD